MTITYHAGRRIQGLSSDVVETPIFEDDGTSYSDQTAYDNAWSSNDTSIIRGNPTNDRIEANFVSDGSENFIYYDLGSAQSNTWLLRMSVDFNAASGTINTYIGLASSPSGYATSMDRIMFGYLSGGIYTLYTDGSDISNSTTNATGITYSVGTKRYFELARIDNVTFQLRGYTDSTFETADGTATTVTIPSTITDLRYIVIGERPVSNTTTGTFYYDDFKFWNGVSSLTSKPTNVQSGSRFEETDTRKIYYGATPSVTFEADFSSSTGWTTTGSNISVDTTAQEIDFTFNTDDADKSVSYYDLTTVSDTNWVLRSQIDIDTVTQGSETNDVFLMYGLGSTVQDGSEVQDFLGLMFRLDDTKTDIFAIETDGSAPNNETTTLFTRQAQAETLYVELKRDSATSFTINLYSDSGYSTLLESKTITASSGTTTLRYLKVTGLQGFANSSLVGSIPNIKFYNGVTSTDLVWTEEV